MSGAGWTGVDLDKTLARYDGDIRSVGEPIAPMVERVKKWLAEGREVRIMTARVSGPDADEQREMIQQWCELHLGCRLPVTCVKDFDMRELWDDRAVQVMPDTGLRVGHTFVRAAARERLRALLSSGPTGTAVDLDSILNAVLGEEP